MPYPPPPQLNERMLKALKYENDTKIAVKGYGP